MALGLARNEKERETFRLEDEANRRRLLDEERMAMDIAGLEARRNAALSAVRPEFHRDLLSDIVTRKRDLPSILTELNSPGIRAATRQEDIERRAILDFAGSLAAPGETGLATTRGGLEGIDRLSNLLRRARLSELEKREAEARESLLTQKTSAQSAIDEQLSRVLFNAGIQAGEQRAQTGAALAERGLSRSTFAQRAIEEDLLREVEAKAQTRALASEQKQALERAHERAIKEIDFGKERTRAAIESENESQFVESLGRLQQVELQNIYAQLDAERRISTQDKVFTRELIGGALGAAGALGAILAL